MSQTLQVQKRKPSVLYSSLKIAGIKEILHIVSQEPLYKQQILKRSQIKMPNTCLKYIQYCKDQGFFDVIPSSFGTRKTKGGSQYHENFIITEKGRTFLELVQ